MAEVVSKTINESLLSLFYYIILTNPSKFRNRKRFNLSEYFKYPAHCVGSKT